MNSLTVYLLDYRGTLDTLPDPAGFVLDLKAQDPDCKVILFSVVTPSDIRFEHRLLLSVVDFLWEQPWDFGQKIQGQRWPVGRVVVADDKLLIRRMIRQVCIRHSWECLAIEPHEILSLLFAVAPLQPKG